MTALTGSERVVSICEQAASALQAVLAKALDKQNQFSHCREVTQLLACKWEPLEPLQDFAPVWPPSAYGLQSVTVFQHAPPAVQRAVLHALGRSRLLEAYGIENAGMSFAAKMSLLAESVEEQMLYSFFAAEEAVHFQLIQSLLGPLPAPYSDPFIAFLRALIQTAERRPLQLIIQVVLEGWGLDHYASLMKTCQLECLKAPLQRILSDEAGHHGSGLALFCESEVTASEQAYILEMMGVFLDMVRVGPVGLLQTLEAELGGLTPSQREEVLQEMKASAETRRKLELLRGLLQKAGAYRTLAALEARQGFALLG